MNRNHTPAFVEARNTMVEVYMHVTFDSRKDHAQQAKKATLAK